MMFRANSRVFGMIAAVAGLGILAASPTFGDDSPAKPDGPRIQIAILLDTSNSMDGLINQARTQLWKIVNEFTTIKLAGQQPRLEVGLFEYGNDNLPAAEGWVRMVVPFTTDLDKVSEAMFALKTRGGEEYCGLVIDKATRTLLWSKSNKDVKCIFIAGNEPFTQGTFDYRKACKAAAARGITVNTIFCGNRQEGINTNWADGVRLADGTYLNINQERMAVEIPTPQDKELSQLSSQLNDTYLYYGSEEKQKDAATRQKVQDANAASAAPSVAAARAGTKGSHLYKNADADLIDAVHDGKVKLDDVKKEQLPAELRDKSPTEQKAIVDTKAKQRAEIQAKIQQLTAARNKYIAAETEKQAAAARAAGKAPAEAQFEQAVTDAVKAEAAKKK